ncbi:hypothetical protein Tco_1215362 [Tanacetum coccineum]
MSSALFRYEPSDIGGREEVLLSIRTNKLDLVKNKGCALYHGVDLMGEEGTSGLYWGNGGSYDDALQGSEETQ